MTPTFILTTVQISPVLSEPRSPASKSIERANDSWVRWAAQTDGALTLGELILDRDYAGSAGCDVTRVLVVS
jgi:hypothetical protein